MSYFNLNQLLIAGIIVLWCTPLSAKEVVAVEDDPPQDSVKPTWSKPYGIAGCGAGSIIIGRKGGQIFAGSSNLTSSQAFAITSGTSNCEDNPTNVVAERMDLFFSANRASVAADVARRGGETLHSLFAILGCSTVPERFGLLMQKNFHLIFQKPEIEPSEFSDAVITLILNDSRLSSDCKNLI